MFNDNNFSVFLFGFSFGSTIIISRSSWLWQFNHRCLPLTTQNLRVSSFIYLFFSFISFVLFNGCNSNWMNKANRLALQNSVATKVIIFPVSHGFIVWSFAMHTILIRISFSSRFRFSTTEKCRRVKRKIELMLMLCGIGLWCPEFDIWISRLNKLFRQPTKNEWNKQRMNEWMNYILTDECLLRPSNACFAIL